jgi:hypothetical protein
VQQRKDAEHLQNKKQAMFAEAQSEHEQAAATSSVSTKQPAKAHSKQADASAPNKRGTRSQASPITSQPHNKKRRTVEPAEADGFLLSWDIPAAPAEGYAHYLAATSICSCPVD